MTNSELLRMPGALVACWAFEVKVGDVVQDFHFAGLSMVVNVWEHPVAAAYTFHVSTQQTVHRMSATQPCFRLSPVAADAWKQAREFDAVGYEVRRHG